MITNTMVISIQLSMEVIEDGELHIAHSRLQSGRYDYTPGDLDSMRNAIDQAAQDLEQKRSEIVNLGFPVDRVFISFVRPDGTIINEIDGNNICSAKEIINNMCTL